MSIAPKLLRILIILQKMMLWKFEEGYECEKVVIEKINILYQRRIQY